MILEAQGNPSLQPAKPANRHANQSWPIKRPGGEANIGDNPRPLSLANRTKKAGELLGRSGLQLPRLPSLITYSNDFTEALYADTALDTCASKKGRILVNRLGNHQPPSGLMLSMTTLISMTTLMR